ncbi:MAG TPA: CsbD family protein [Planctomycetota bacterium]|nr:CsbD family protein [Planctomycetota bacterium]
MNKDIAAGKWKQMQGRFKQWWGKLTDDDIETIEGNYDKLVGKLQERYGYSREQAEQECKVHNAEAAMKK